MSRSDYDDYVRTDVYLGGVEERLDRVIELLSLLIDMKKENTNKPSGQIFEEKIERTSISLHTGPSLLKMITDYLDGLNLIYEVRKD